MTVTQQPPPQPRIHRESWLLKRAEWRFAWDRRFFIQDGLRLAYRVAEFGPEKKAGYITTLQRVVGSPQSFTFCVWLKEGDCWTLRTESEEEHREWTGSIAAALLKDSEEESFDVREGVVLKKTAWTKKWRQRYFELTGPRLAYRESKDGAIRNRFDLVAVDVSGEESKGDRLLVTTSCGERFWMRFADVEQCDDWKGVMFRGLRQTVPWHWMSLLPSQASEYATLRVQYHATAVGNGAYVYCYGGATTLATRWVHCQTPQILVPQVRREDVSRKLSRIQLAGEHPCTALDILPFEESAHAKLRPPPSMGAALCMLKAKNLSSLSSSAEVTSSLECLLLVGGRGETCVVRETTVEAWWCVLRGFLTQWQRGLYDARTLPHRTFHTLTARDSTKALLIGGIDNMNRVCADCFLISWSDIGETTFNTPPVVEFFGFLPAPRAFHVCLSLHDASLLVLGGCGIGENAFLSSVLRLPAAESEWQEVTVLPPLPTLERVCATVASFPPFPHSTSGDLVFILGETRILYPMPRLFQLTLHASHATSREIVMAIGAVPRRCCGAKMHSAAGHVYVLGGCYDRQGSDDPNDAVSFRDPLRMFIGEHTEGDGAAQRQDGREEN